MRSDGPSTRTFWTPRLLIALLATGGGASASEQVAANDGADQPVEEVLVTAPTPERGTLPNRDYIRETYAARARGATLYRLGRYEEAFPYLLAAAKRGFKFAQARVGFLYQQGLGTPQDPDAAVGFLGVAAMGASMPEIRNHFRALWRRIPEEHHTYYAALIDRYDQAYGAEANRVACDRNHKAGTHFKHLTCRFVDESVYGQEELGQGLTELGVFGSAPGE